MAEDDTDDKIAESAMRVSRCLVELRNIGAASHELRRAQIDLLIGEGRVTENDDGTLTYHLDEPIRVMADKIEALTFGRVNMGHVKEMHKRGITGDERAECLFLLTRTATYLDGKGHTGKLIDNVADQIDGSEIDALQTVSRFFLHRTHRRTSGVSSSAS